MHFRSGRGFIILFGTTTLARNEGSSPVHCRCPACQQEADLVGKVVKPWFTLFFIPIFPMGSGQRITECTRCKARFNAPLEALRSQGARVDQRQWQAAIQVYNILRENPTDAVTLFRLMQMYAAMGEPQEAISAAHTFPQALAQSRECQSLLAQLEQSAAAPS